MGDMVSLVSVGLSYLRPAWKVFHGGRQSCPKDSFSVVVVYLFLPCKCKEAFHSPDGRYADELLERSLLIWGRGSGGQVQQPLMIV